MSLPETPEIPPPPETPGKSPAGKDPPKNGPLEIALALACLAVAAWIVLTAFNAAIPWGFAFLWSAATLAMIASSRFPEIGLYSFIALTYGSPRYEIGFFAMASSGTSNWICLLALAGWAIWMFRHKHAPSINDWLTRLLMLFVVWLAITTTAAAIKGLPWDPRPLHHPFQFLQALALFLIAAHTLATPSSAWRLCLVLCSTLCLRGLFSGAEGIYLEGDISALAVLCLPLALLGAQISRRLLSRALMIALGLGLLSLLVISQNRAAALAFITFALLSWGQSRYKWPIFAAATPILILVAVWFISSDYWGRFTGIWEGTEDRNSVIQRLELWQAGWRMFLAHPWVGVGLSHFPHLVRQYLPHLDDQYAAHNNFIHLLAEAGAPGLLLYLAFFSGVLIALRQTARVVGPDWPGPPARAVFTALCVYLVLGCFISRHDLVLAYILAGWAAALRRSVFNLNQYPPLH